MKVVFIGRQRIPSREGGIEVVVEELAARMAARGHQAAAYSRKGHNVYKSDGSSDGSLPRSETDSEILAQNATQEEHQRHRRRRSPEQIRRIKRRRLIRRILIGVGIVLLILVALAVWFGWSALRVKDEATQAVEDVSTIQQDVTNGDMSSASDDISAFAGHIDDVYAQTSSPVWALASWIPHYGADVSVIRDIAEILEDVSNNALPHLATAVDAFDINSLGIEDGAVQLGSLNDIADDLNVADDVISDAAIDLNNISGATIPELSDALESVQEQFNDMADMVNLVDRVANVAPSMCDLTPDAATDGEPRTYLVLVQNNAELRSTGGIPGSWGVLTVNGGSLSIGDFDSLGQNGVFDSPVVDLTAEEQTLFSDKLAERFQDVNFTPDFTRTGEIASTMWEQIYGQNVDGVISIDPVFLQRLLAVTGSVTLDDGTELTGDNAAQILLNQTYFDYADNEDQDAFFSSAAATVFTHILDSANGKGTDLISAVYDAVVDGHVYLWSAHSDEQEWLSGTAIAGELGTNPAEPVAGVYFNDGTTSKMDWYLQREITVTPGDIDESGAQEYTVNITMTNTADSDAAETFPDYVLGTDEEGNERHGEIATVLYVYAPADGRLIDWTATSTDESEQESGDFDLITTHDGLTVGAKEVTIEPGQTFEMTVHLSASAVAEENSLVLRSTPQGS